MAMNMAMAMAAIRADPIVVSRASPKRRAKRTPQEWGVRGGLAAVALLLGYVSTMQTLGFASSKVDLERAHTLAPGDGRIAGALAQRIAATDASPAERQRADRLARQALADEPLAVTAITALALDKQLAGDTASARRLFLRSDAMSRRDLGTRLWLIEDAVARGDVIGAMRHYDIALRTEKGAADLLFPILSNAISDPAIAAALRRTLAAKPSWGEAFVFQLGVAEADPVVRAHFLRDLTRDGRKVPEATQFGVLNALMAVGAINEAWNFYAAQRPGVRRDRSRDARFTMSFETPMAFDWNVGAGDNGISASIQNEPDGGVFDFAAPATVGGVLLQQAQFLPPGRYRVSGKTAEIEQEASSRPYWTLVCSGGREVGRLELPNSSTGGGLFSGDFVVGPDCPVQYLRLIARPSSNTGGVTGRIERVALMPVKTR